MEYVHFKSQEKVRQIIKYKLYEVLNEEEQKRMLRISGRTLSKIGKAKRIFSRDSTDIAKRLISYNNWRLFYAQVVSIKGITQPKDEGENDYCLFYPNGKTLYIAKEMFHQLPEDTVSEFVFFELGKDKFSRPEIQELFNDENYSKEAYERNQLLLHDYIRRLVRRRVIHYTLEDFVEGILNYATEYSISKKRGLELSSERKSFHEKERVKIIKQFLKNTPDNLAGFSNCLTKKTSYEEISQSLGQLGVWSAMVNKLIKTTRINIATTDLNEFIYNSVDLKTVVENYLKFDYLYDTWTEMEHKKLIEESSAFIESLKEESERLSKEFYEYLSNNNASRSEALENARARLEELEGLIESLPEVSKGLFDDITEKFAQMTRVYETTSGEKKKEQR